MTNIEKNQDRVGTKSALLKRGNYTILPNEAEELEPYDLKVLMHIVKRCGQDHKKEFFESVRNAAKCLKMDVVTYRKSLLSLEHKKVISITRNPGQRSLICWNDPNEWNLEEDNEEFGYKKKDEGVRNPHTPDCVKPSHTPCETVTHHCVKPSHTPCETVTHLPIIEEKDPQNQIQHNKNTQEEALCVPESTEFDLSTAPTFGLSPEELATDYSQSNDAFGLSDIDELDTFTLACMYEKRIRDLYPTKTFDVYSEDKAIQQSLKLLGHSIIDAFRVYAYIPFDDYWNTDLKPSDLIKNTKKDRTVYENVYAKSLKSLKFKYEWELFELGMKTQKKPASGAGS